MNNTLIASSAIGATAGNTSLIVAPEQPAWLHVVVTLMPFVLSALKSIFGKKQD